MRCCHMFICKSRFCVCKEYEIQLGQICLFVCIYISYISEGADADNGMAHLITFIHL
jgi:hypothetical protein